MNPLETAHLTLLSSQTCSKLSATAEGKLSFNIWLDPHDQSFYLALTHNESGGYFSHELVPVKTIIDCLRPLKAANQAFPAVRLRTTFQGKSANNPSFLAAVLRHLKILTPCTSNTSLHLVADDLEQWPSHLSQFFTAKSNDSSDMSLNSPNQLKPPKARGKTANKSLLESSSPNDAQPDTTTIMENDHENHS